MLPYVVGLAAQGTTARAIDLPLGLAERAVAAYRRQVPDLTNSVIGGHSYGGRVASLLAADERPRGLILLSYPLHRPGHPSWAERTEHWARIRCPVLLLSGESDQFAAIELLRLAVERLADRELVTYPRVRHGLAPVLDDALDRITRFVARL
jgi:predicted alpha/beta-hydrolase family hydrolase